MDPGSERHGVPASDIKEIIDPDFKKAKLCSPYGVASISWIKKNGPSINTGPF